MNNGDQWIEKVNFQGMVSKELFRRWRKRNGFGWVDGSYVSLAYRLRVGERLWNITEGKWRP